MRITAGEFRGRRLTVPSVEGLRPTSSKVRQALFNILPPLLPEGTLRGVRVLDLFSGSGIMAVESLSRGAAQVVSCECDAAALRAMRSTAATLQLHHEQWQFVSQRLPHSLNLLHGSYFSLVFADPPYRKGIAEQIPSWLESQQIRCDVLVVEEAADVTPSWPERWQVATPPRRYGNTVLHFIRYV